LQATQAVVIFPHSQQRDVSGWGVLQWGQRQDGMGYSVATPEPDVTRESVSPTESSGLGVPLPW
jgi:hypothetical protein